ncbi:MAG: IclR family transcriptional regulator [Propionicimonas sp.]
MTGEVPRGKRPPHGEPVVDRALALLMAFDERHLYLSLTDLARRSAMPVSTARRLAVRLLEWGVLEKNEAGQYSIGLRLWEVASLADRGLSLRDVASPYLDDLSAVTHQHVQLAVLDDEDALVIDRRLGDEELPWVNYRIGGRIPLVASAVGMVVLAHADTEFQDRVISGEFRWPVHECPRPSATAVRVLLADVRRTGFALLNRATSPVASAATPIRDRHGEVIAAVSVVVARGKVPLSRLQPVLLAASRAISRDMGAPMTHRPTPGW